MNWSYLSAVQTIRDTYSPTSEDDERAKQGSALLALSIYEMQMDWSQLPREVLFRFAEHCIVQEKIDADLVQKSICDH